MLENRVREAGFWEGLGLGLVLTEVERQRLKRRRRIPKPDRAKILKMVEDGNADAILRMIEARERSLIRRMTARYW